MLGALVAALAVVGCVPLEDPNAPLARAMRDAEAAERGIVRRRRGPTWILVRYAVAPGPPGEELTLGAAGEFAVTTARFPPGASCGTLLLRPGRSGFVAVSRGEPVPEFTLDGRTFGGGDEGVDRGFDLVVEKVQGTDLRMELTPVFRRLGEGGADLRAEGQKIEGGLHGAGEAVYVELREGPVAEAVFSGVADGNGETRRPGLYVQVEAFR